MFTDKSFPSRYFNGVSAVPKTGIVRIQNSVLSFFSEDTTEKLLLQNFESFSKTPKGIKLTVFADEHKESPVLEIFCEKHDSKVIENAWVEIKKKSSQWNRFVFSVRQTNVIALVFIAAVISSMIGFLYVLGLDYLPHILPRTVDYKLGEAVQKQVEQQFKTCDTKEANLFFTEAIKKIKPPNNNYKYSVSLINRPEPNAISLSNGKIYFFTGLLSNAKNQAEVVGVLAHEIAHVEKRHHVRNLTKALGTTFAISVLIGPGLGDYQFVETLTELGSTFLILKYSRDFESEADQTSIELLKKTNFTTKGLMTFFETIKDYESNFKTEKKNENSGSKQNNPSKPSFDITEFLSTHPATEQRIEDLKSFLPQENKNVKTEIVSKQMWEKIQSACAD